MLTTYLKYTSTKGSMLMVILTGLLLAGCINAQTNVALYGQGEWSGVQAMTLSAEFVELMNSSDTDVDASVDTQDIDQWHNNLWP